jgi:hypothetical protein
MNAIDFISNVVVADTGLRASLDRVNPILWATMNGPGRLPAYVAIDFLFGALLVWLYAAIRPRFGPGPRTALRAAAFAWGLYMATELLFVLMGLFSMRFFVLNAALSAVNYAASSLAGARIYREA